jgi:hypothetical protein
VCHSRDFCLSGAIEMVNWAQSGALLFSSPCQRQCELLPSLGIRRLLTFHILIFSSETLSQMNCSSSLLFKSRLPFLLPSDHGRKHALHFLSDTLFKARNDADYRVNSILRILWYKRFLKKQCLFKRRIVRFKQKPSRIKMYFRYVNVLILTITS